MKQNLGKIFFLFLNFFLLQAEDFSYQFALDNTNPYVKEAVILTLDLNQTNHEVVLFFDFTLKKSDAYSFQRVGVEESNAHHHAQIHYDYLIYPLKSGNVKLSFELIKKVTTDESVAYSFSGDRDNVKGLATHNNQVSLPSIELQVKPLLPDTQLVGDFSLKYVAKKHQSKSYETFPFEVIIAGKGYPPVISPLVPKDTNFTLFSDLPMILSDKSIHGTQNTVSYSMALSHDESFTFPAIILKAFNPQTKKYYSLNIPSQDFNISKAEPSNLVDKIDNPKPLNNEFFSNSFKPKTLFLYLLIFLSGLLTAVIFTWRKNHRIQTQHPLIEKIKNAKDKKSLLQILLSVRSKHFSSIIEILESSLYGNTKISLKKLKRKSISKIKKRF